MSPKEEFITLMSSLLQTPEVQAMKRWRHHFSITCYEHSLFVSYVAFRLARSFGWNRQEAARADIGEGAHMGAGADGGLAALG